MSITRLNHAVLFVRDLDRSVAFYSDVLGFRVIPMAPDGFRAAFLQAEGSTNDHDLGLFEIGAGAGPVNRRPRRGRPVPPGLGSRHARRARPHLAGAGRRRCTRRLLGPRHHQEPVRPRPRWPRVRSCRWIVPADRLTDEARQARSRIGHLDLDRENSATAVPPAAAWASRCPPPPDSTHWTHPRTQPPGASARLWGVRPRASRGRCHGGVSDGVPEPAGQPLTGQAPSQASIFCSHSTIGAMSQFSSRWCATLGSPGP